jgi:UDP-glucose 4-epimerase
MVSEEEAHHCVKRGDYYAILPMLPELAARTKEKRGALSREFSSADNVLDLEGTGALLKRHRLMPDDVEQAELGELLR